MLTKEQIKQIVDNHQLWLQTTSEEGQCADFSNADLCDYKFENVNLSWAKFNNALLNDAKFVHVILYETSFYKACLRRTLMRFCDISHADFKSTDMQNASIEYSQMHHTDFSESNLKLSEHWTVHYSTCVFNKSVLSLSEFKYCHLHNCVLSDAVSNDVRYRHSILESLECTNTDFTRSDFRNSVIGSTNTSLATLDDVDIEYANFTSKNIITCFNHSQSDRKSTFGMILKEPMIGYKKTLEEVVITVEIPIGAVVFCINGSKCRANKAKIIDMQGHKQLTSWYSSDVKYRLNEEIEIENFDMRYNVECGPGFHFFKSYKEAEAYPIK